MGRCSMLPGGRGEIRRGLSRYITITEYYHFVSGNATPGFPSALQKLSTVAAMLQFVIHQLRQRRALPAVPLGLLFVADAPQPGQVLPPGAHLKKLKCESLMFNAA
jgi:hypothetical protein